MKVIIAAAGTAGHINPGIAIANKIKQEQPDSEIIFIGTNRKLEKDLVSRAGYEHKAIEAYGLTLANLTKVFKMLKFRSMVVNAESMGTGLFNYENDPRVTKVGRFLRNSSIFICIIPFCE